MSSAAELYALFCAPAIKFLSRKPMLLAVLLNIAWVARADFQFGDGSHILLQMH
jgi:hypothetical protein